MVLVILDPNLDGPAGHHLAYDLAIAREALARGQAATIVANRRFPATEVEGVRVLPHFTATTYAVRHADPVTGAADDWRHFNDLLLAELQLLPRSLTPPEAAVLAPTVTENHLAGYLGWMKAFDPLEAPLFLVHLMFPSGVTLDAAGAPVVEEPLRALFYRLAERLAREPGPEVHLFASGLQHAAEYGALFGRPVPAHPLPIRPLPDRQAAGCEGRVLVFAGDARADKGITLLPRLLPALAAAHPDRGFVAHVNAETAWGEAKPAADALAALGGTRPNIEVMTGRLPPEAYAALLRSVGLMVFPYDPGLYRRKSSGILWEAVSLGTPVVVPAGTWLENEARHWGAGHVAHAAHAPEAIAAAVAEALARLSELAAVSAAAAERYRAANGAAALLDQIAALWVRHQAAASLLARPGIMALEIDRLEAGWHQPETLEGQPIRWSQQEPEIAFDWPFETPWELELTLLAYFGAEQLERAQVEGNTGPVTLTWAREGRGARLILRGAGPGRARPRVALRLRLPYTYRPPNERRDLGVLVTAMRIGPVAAGAPVVPEAAARPALRLPPAAAGGGWPLAPSVAGQLWPEPDRPCVLAFRLRAATGGAPPAVALAIGVGAARLTLTEEAEGRWLGTATLPAALLRAAGEPVVWELTAEGGGEVVLIAAEASPLAVTTRPLGPAAAPADPPSAPTAPPGQVQGSAAPRLRWDLAAGFGEPEGPFPELGLPAGVRWAVARAARLVLEAPAAGAARLRLRYRSLVPRQVLRARLNGAPLTEAALAGGGLAQGGEVTLDLALRVGANELALEFGPGVAEPGTGRELVLLVERAEVAPAV